MIKTARQPISEYTEMPSHLPPSPIFNLITLSLASNISHTLRIYFSNKITAKLLTYLANR